MKFEWFNKKTLFCSAELDEFSFIFNQICVVWYYIFFLAIICLFSCSEEASTTNDDKSNGTILRKDRNETIELVFNQGEKRPSLTGKIKFEGIKMEKFEDGSNKEMLNYVGGQKNGLFQKWFSNGQLERRGNFKDDRLDGLIEAWHPNGSPDWIGHYKDGVRNGKWTFFDKEGNAMPSIYFQDGVEVTRVLPPLRK